MKNLIYCFALGALMLAACTDSHKPNDAAVKSANTPFVTPEWATSAVLYECHVRQFSPEGNFAGVAKQLGRLKELGIDALWIMPFQPIGVKNRKGALGSPYSIQDYYAVNPDYGTLDDLKNLVRQAHDTGLKVIFDWVPNHTAWDAVWMKQHPDFYTMVNGAPTVPLNENGGSTGWDDVADLNYDNPALRKEMIRAMQYWLRTCDIDGFRVDMAGLVPNDFWQQVRPALDSVKPVFMLAEWQDEPKHFSSCFNANYGWKWKDVTKDIANGKQPVSSLDTLLAYLNGFYPEGYFQLYFTQNHDENSWSGTEYDLYGNAADVFNVLSFTWQGMPMLYNGQEDELTQRLAFFEKDPVRWKTYGKTPFYQNLCALRHNNKALRAGAAGGRLAKIKTSADGQVYAFSREKDGDKVLVITNLSNDPVNITLDPSEHLLGAYTDVFGASTIQVTKDMDLNLKPWGYLVLTNK